MLSVSHLLLHGGQKHHLQLYLRKVHCILNTGQLHLQVITATIYASQQNLVKAKVRSAQMTYEEKLVKSSKTIPKHYS